MSELGGDYDDGVNVGGEAEEVGNEGSTTSTEGIESMGSVSETEISIGPGETSSGMNQILETPQTLEQAQRSVETYHTESISQILENDGKYMEESDRARVAEGVDNIRAIPYNPYGGKTGTYSFRDGKSEIRISAVNETQMERSTKHETNHFASKNREIIVPAPDRHGYTVYKTVGTHQQSWFHSAKTGENFDYSEKGRGLNEGLTTMYTNQQLTELSEEKGQAARQQGIYEHTTELCTQLEAMVGEDTLKEAYYGGNLQALEEKVNNLAGGKEYESLREAMDRTLSKDYAERMQAMKDAQAILEKMYENGGGKI